jgi:hypothetical protein
MCFRRCFASVAGSLSLVIRTVVRMGSTLTAPTEDFRSVVLRGANVASYKFALASSLLELAGAGQEAVPLEVLAGPFSRAICEHLREVDTQGTSAGSRFLNACRHHNAGLITDDELRDSTVLLGFNNVLDAFHTVGSEGLGTRFFVDERRDQLRGIRLTDDLLRLAERPETALPLAAETQSRWALVENAWHEKRSTGNVLTVEYDRPSEMIVRGMLGHRRSLTWVRPSLSGYQAGQCFYCGAGVSPLLGLPDSADVDHYFPHVLMSRGLFQDLDHVWNLVLTCSDCNRGIGGKFDRLAHPDFLDRLWQRNERLIMSHHPLRESIIAVTGRTPADRAGFLTAMQNEAQMYGRLEWRPPR